jgi:hypothetical protein
LKISTGLAIANVGTAAGTVTLSLTGPDGAPIASTATPLPLPASGQVVAFVDQLMPSLAGQTFQGVLRITTSVSSISVVGLRAHTNERGDFLITTTPPTNENAPPAAAELVFPHLVSGGGYVTQVVLFGGAGGQVSAGNLSFTKQDGTALDLDIQ